MSNTLLIVLFVVGGAIISVGVGAIQELIARRKAK